MISVIDMGRTMQMPFNGMTLLDYAINTALVMSNIAIVKHDKAGLVTFNDEIQTIIPPRKESHHIQTIMEALYNQQTTLPNGIIIPSTPISKGKYRSGAFDVILQFRNHPCIKKGNCRFCNLWHANTWWW